MLTIRAKNINEYATVEALWHTYCQEIGGVFSEHVKQRIRQILAQYPPHPDADIVIAEFNNQIIGFIVYSITQHPITNDRTAEIEELYVSPAHRRNGIGTQLITHIEEKLSMQNIIAIRIVPDDNPASLGFWNKMGFIHELPIRTKVNFRVT